MEGSVTGNWLAPLDADDQAEFFADLHAAVALARHTGNVEPVDACLHDWRITAEALSDPARREILTGTPEPADFAEVQRPEGTDG